MQTAPQPANIFAANLAQLRRTEPELCQRLLDQPPASLQWAASNAGPLWATIDHQGRQLALASRYDPIAEAEKLASSVDHTKHGGIVVLGLGLGYHVAHIARHMGNNSLLVVFEPNLALLRAVLERIDHTAWLGRPNVVLADDHMDRAALLGRVEYFSAMMMQGIALVTHPPSRQMHAEALKQFGQMVTEALSYCRTHVATAIVNATRTYRNLALNLPYYVAGASTDDLYEAARGYPAVCVGAGPSLVKNVDLLTDPAVRQNVVVITAQTTLKPLLARGIRPDFVTALDYHEISRRFYEGLPDLPDVTLVAEPLANPAILDSYPGPIRVTNHKFLDGLLGALAQPRIPVPYGATVAHLSFYVAQHLGCDPIILIGQDLGFSDGLYYSPGTAIHDVWAPELGPFNTLEMMEWQRIVRHKPLLRKLRDIHGRPIYSDEQMLTYLKQFERDFAKAPQKVLDASEGGLPKDHTTATTLAEALSAHATRPVPRLPTPPRRLDPDRLAAASRLLRQRTDEVTQIRQLSRKAIPLLRQMIEHQRDRPRMNQLLERVEKIKRRVNELHESFNVINDLNALGAFRRARADRAIFNTDTDEFERQRRQIDRDLDNLDMLIQACEEAMKIFRDALERVEHHQRLNRSPRAPQPAAA